MADSPWQLGDADHDLIVQLADGWANAVRETASVPEDVIQSWQAARKTRGNTCVVGHKDLLALPPLR